MNDTAWCRTRVDTLDGDLLRLGHGGRGFAEALAEARLTWADAAAREVFGRFLDPHGGETAGVRERLLAQVSLLREVVSRMAEAELPSAELHHLSDESARRRQQAERELDTAHHRTDHSLDEAAVAEQRTQAAVSTLQSI